MTAPASIVLEDDAAGNLDSVAAYMERAGFSPILCEHVRTKGRKINRGRPADSDETREARLHLARFKLAYEEARSRDIPKNIAIAELAEEFGIPENLARNIIRGGRPDVKRLARTLENDH